LVLFILRDNGQTLVTRPETAEPHISNVSAITDIESPRNRSDGKKPTPQKPVITRADVGKELKIIGNVLSVFNHPDGHKFLKVLILDSEQEITIPVFSRLGYKDARLGPNSIIRVSGKVSLYKENLQVVPNKASEIEILKEGPEVEKGFIKIADIDIKMRGQTVRIKAKVRGSHTTSGGTTIVNLFDDSEAVIKGVLFRSTAAELIGRELLLKMLKRMVLRSM
jgi:RecG-like helicase